MKISTYYYNTTRTPKNTIQTEYRISTEVEKITDSGKMINLGK
jgi:hypothetical protein